MSLAKHRPALTVAEISALNKIIKQYYIDNITTVCSTYDQEVEDNILGLMNKFSALNAKIANQVVKPAYSSRSTTHKEDTLLDLGGTVAPNPGSPSIGARRLAAYERYTIDPTSCTFTEIADAMEYRYQHQLMPEAEHKAYEAKMWEAAL
jgi:hypothetical protein